MLLQRQYSLWKSANYLVWSIVVWLGIGIAFLNWRAGSVKEDINQKQAELVQLEKQIDQEKNKDVYQKYKMASVILKKENNTNYYGLYKYLESLKDDLEELLKNTNIPNKRFKLTVWKNSVKISLLVPDYNILYRPKTFIKDKNGKSKTVKWIFTNLAEKKFIKQIDINAYKKSPDGNGIIFDLNIKTK